MGDVVVEPDEQAPYTEATRARVAMAVVAREVAELAAAMVPIPARSIGGADTGGALVESAANVCASAELLLRRAVTAAAIGGATWQSIGDALETSRQQAHRRYAEAVAEFERTLADPYADAGNGIVTDLRPTGADDPAGRAADLDEWVRDHQGSRDRARSNVDPDRPVSGGLARLDPHTELGQLSQQRWELLERYAAPPPEQLLAILEREATLWARLAAAEPRHRQAADDSAARASDYRAQLTTQHTEPANTQALTEAAGAGRAGAGRRKPRGSRSSRSRHMHRLADLLEQHTGLRGIRSEYRGGGSDPSYSGWHLSWSDGPTKDEMRELVGHLANHVPDLDTAELRYSRNGTDLGEVVALLRYLDQHPDEVADYPFMFTTQRAFDMTPYPERSDEPWRRRARALLSVGRHDGERALAEHASRDSWPAALDWLDNIHAAAADPTIAKLDQARARRMN